MIFLSLWFIAIIYILCRIQWVYNQRIKWIHKNVYEFERLAPSFNIMVFKFWIWDMHKFGLPK